MQEPRQTIDPFTEQETPARQDFPPTFSKPQAQYSQQRFLSAAAVLTTAYLCAMFLGHPLVFTSFYFNITETKQAYFLIASGAYLLLVLFARIALPPDFGTARPRIRLHPTVLLLFAFFVISVMGSLLSQYRGEAFFGENNRYQGLLTLFCYAGVVFALSRRTLDLRWPVLAFLLGACLASLLGVLNHFTLDPFGFYTKLRAQDLGRFLSTIGNADFYASYIGMAFAVSLGYFLHVKTTRQKAFALVSLVFVSFGTLVAGSDSAVLAIRALAAFAPLLVLSDAAALRRLVLGWGVFFLCAFVFGLLSNIFPSSTYLSGFVTVLGKPVVSLPLFAIALALWFALRYAKPERLARAKRPYAYTLAGAVLLGVVVLVLLNTVLRSLPLGRLERYLHFSASWGTDRGKIWMFVMQVYERMSLAQKLFGASSGGLFHADSVKPIFSDAALDTAHNEYLQYLVTNGALGLICYLASLGFAVWAGLSRSKEDAMSRGLTLAVAAYAVQAVVNIAQPMTTPLFIILVGVLVSRSTQAPSRADNDSL